MMSTGSTCDVSELFSRAMIGLDDEGEVADAHDTGWNAIWRLRDLGNSEVLSASLAACTDPDPVKRRVGGFRLGTTRSLDVERSSAIS